MEYTTDQLEQALVRLYHEGRDDEARVIAGEIQKRRTPQETAPATPDVPERTTEQAIDDTFRGATAGLSQMAGDMIRGGAVMASGAVKYVAEGNIGIPRASPVSAGLNLLHKGVTALTEGTTPEEKKQDLQQATEAGTALRQVANVLASPTDKFAGWVREGMSPEGKKLSNTPQIQGNILEILKGNESIKDIFTPEATAAGIIQNTANMFGSVLWSLAISKLSGSFLITGITSGLPGGQEGANEARQRLKRISDADLADDSPLFASLLRDGWDPAMAREHVIQKAEEAAAYHQAPLSGFSDALGAKLILKGTNRVNQIGNRVVRAAARGGLAMGQDAVGETLEGFAAERGINTIAETPYGQDSVSNFIYGGLSSGPAAVVTGSMSEGPSKDGPDRRPNQDILSDLTKIGETAKKIEESPVAQEDIQSLPMTEEEAMSRGEPARRNVTKMTDDEAMDRGEPQFTKSVVELENELTPSLKVEINGVATVREGAVAANDESKAANYEGQDTTTQEPSNVRIEDYDLSALQLYNLTDQQLRQRAYKKAKEQATEEIETEDAQRRSDGKAAKTPAQLKKAIEKRTNQYIPEIMASMRKARNNLSSFSPEFIASEKKRRAKDMFEASVRQSQLNKADTLDQPTDPLKSTEVESQTTPERRKALITAIENGKFKAPNRNNELSAVLDSVAASLDPNTTPASFAHILNKVIAAIKAIEAMGFYTKVDIAREEQYLQYYVNTGEKVSSGVAFSRTPNARRPNGEYVVALRYDKEGGNGDGMNLTTLLHESVHVATIGAIEAVEKGLTTDPNLKKAVEDIRAIKTQVFEDYIEGKTKEKGDLYMHANKDLYEFLAYGMTSPTLQMYMKRTADRRKPKRTLWNEFKRAVLSSLGITEKKGVTQYETLLNSLDTILNAPINDAASALTWLSYSVTEGFTAHQNGGVDELLTPEMTVDIRQRAEAAFLRREQDPNKSPYGAFSDLSVNEPAEGYVFHGMMEDELFAGQVPQQPNGNRDAPYVFVSKEGDPGFNVIVNVPNSTLHLALKHKFPGYTIMTPSQGLHYIRTGQTPVTIMGNARAATNNAAVNQALTGLLGRSVDTKMLEPFMDIHDAQTAIALQKLDGRDLPTNLGDFLVNGPNAQAVIHNIPLIRYIRQSVHRIVKAQSVMARHHVLPMSQLWFKMSDDSRQLAMQIAIHQDQIQRDFTAQELTSAGVPSEVIHLLQIMRTALDTSIQEWNQHRTALGLDPVNVRQGYFPSLFTGDYRSVVRDGNGHVIGVVTSDTEIGLKQKQKKIKEKFSWAEFDPHIRIGMERRNLYSDSAWDQIELISKFMSSSQASQQTKTEFSQFLQSLSIDDARHILGFSRHEKHKVGIWGSKGRDPTMSAKENSHEAFQGMIMYLEDGANHHAQMLTLADIADITSDPEMRKDYPRTVQYLDDLYQHISRRKPPSGAESRQAGALHSVGRGVDSIIEGALRLMGVGPNSYRKNQSILRTLFSTSAMGFGNIGFTFLQIMQVVQCGPQAAAYLRASTGLNLTSTRSRLASAKAVVALLRLFMDFMGNKFGNGPIQGMDWFGGDADTRAAVQYAVENNLITLNDLELAQTAMLSPTERKFDIVANINQRAAEAGTRPLVFMWLYNILKDTNLTKEQQYEVARNATNFVMAEYHSTARPMLYAALGTTGPLFGQLKTFAHSNAGQQIFWSKTAVTGVTMRPMIALMIAYLLYVGADDMPIYDELDTILKLTTKGLNAANPDVPVLSYKDWLAPHMPDMFKYGIISHYSGIDFQKRLRMPPLINEQLMGNLPAINWAAEGVSSLFKFAMESYRQKELDKPLGQKALYTITPSSLKGPMEHWFYKEPGTNNEKTKDWMGRWTHRNDFDWNLRWLGFRSLEDTLRKEQVSGTKQKLKAEHDEKKRISDEYVRLHMTKGGIQIEKYHELRGKYIQLGGKSEELDERVNKAKERYAKGETMSLFDNKDPEKTWFFYNESRR